MGQQLNLQRLYKKIAVNILKERKYSESIVNYTRNVVI